MPTTTIDYFEYDHLPAEMQQVAKPISYLAHLMEDTLPDGPEKSAGMRKLLEAKDCFVRTKVVTKFERARAEELQYVRQLCQLSQLAAPENRDAVLRKAVEAALELDDFTSQYKSAFSKLCGVTIREFDRMMKALRDQKSTDQSAVVQKDE